MRYSYDPAKKKSNLTKHGLDFDEAKRVIESGNTVTFEDNRYDYDEPRFITLGNLDGSIVVIVTTESDSEIRIISMRKADKNEQKIYFNNL
ncbi:BrnT family toxin [Undibacterium sp. WLHG33]|uniref:BrnT family toxin n=1 Tax=Undibacterium sp. WLHG33 TaxID=3412482 RepID=UPI003C2C1EFF